MKNEATALPVVSNMQQLSELGTDAQVAPGFQESTKKHITTENAQKIGLASHDEMLQSIGNVFAKYEVPQGLLSKLFKISEFEQIEIIVDNSGSMSVVDAKIPGTNHPISRWHEVRYRLAQMFEILAYVPFPPVHIVFINGPDRLVIARDNGHERPEEFLKRATSIIDGHWARGPDGGTPAYEAIRDSLARYQGIPTIRYFFGDGVPNGGEADQRRITELIKTRAFPEKNPFTFFSCTSEDSCVGWMRDCEEVAPYCSEYDDFESESEEVRSDQGKAFSYSFGMHLVGQLVGACFPEDLDALDEAIPFPKAVMSELLGYQLTDAEYDYYFAEFLVAQRAKRSSGSAEDKIKEEFCRSKWPNLRENFRAAHSSKEIPEVKEYHQRLLEAERQNVSTSVTSSSGIPYQSSSARSNDECCCVIQ